MSGLTAGFRHEVDEVCALMDVFIVGFLDPWIWDRRVVLKRRYGSTSVRCVVSQYSADVKCGLSIEPCVLTLGSCVVVRSSVALSHRQPASSGTFRGNCRAQDSDKRKGM